jgi:hypothetical protein
MMTGLEPRGFTWVISARLAVSERIGGYGFQHRRVRREEEISWLSHHGVTAVLSLLDGNQNLESYRSAGLAGYHAPLRDTEQDTVLAILDQMYEILQMPGTVLLIHRDTIDDSVAGLLAGYLVYSGLVEDPIVATAAVQEILKRPLGPAARRMIPQTAGA